MVRPLVGHWTNFWLTHLNLGLSIHPTFGMTKAYLVQLASPVLYISSLSPLFSMEMQVSVYMTCFLHPVCVYPPQASHALLLHTPVLHHSMTVSKPITMIHYFFQHGYSVICNPSPKSHFNPNPSPNLTQTQTITLILILTLTLTLTQTQTLTQTRTQPY